VVGDKIKELRTKKGILQQDLADALNVSKSTVAMWETNKREPNADTLAAIATFFNVPAGYLLGDDSISDIYLSWAKKAQDEEINPDDIDLAIHILKQMRGEN